MNTMSSIAAVYDQTHPAATEMYLHDMLGQLVLKTVDEPGFANLENLCPPMRETRTVLGLPDYPVAIGLDWDGTLNRGGIGFVDRREPKDVNPRDILFFCVGTPPKPVRELGWDKTRRCLDAGLPIVTTDIECQGLVYRQTVFACSKGMSSNEDIEVMIRWQVENATGRRKPYQVRMSAAPHRPTVVRDVSGKLAPGQTQTHFWRVLYRNSRERRELTTLPGYPHTNELFARWNIRPAVSSATPAVFEENLAACKTAWNKLLASGMQITTPEARVNDGFRAWQVYNRINTRGMKIKGRTAAVPHDGSGFYGNVYGITALSTVHSLILTGHLREAFKVLKDLCFYQHKDGLFFQNYGLCDNGLFLYVIAQYALVSNDLKGFKKLLPRACKAVQWLRNNRTPLTGKPLTAGLLCKGQYTADVVQADFCYMSDAYNWLGLAEMSRALARAGLGPEARALGTEARQYRRAILASMKKASVPENELVAPGEVVNETSFLWRHRPLVKSSRLTVVPMTPVSRSLERRFLGGYYYAFALGHLLETELLDPDDPLCREAVAYMEQRGGILLGLQRWCEYAGIDHAYSYGYLMTKLRQDNVPAVLLGFYAMLAYGMDRDTYAGTEVVDLIEGKPHYGPWHYQPHTLSNTMQIRLLRMMLVREEGRELHLGFAVPRPWTADLQVKDAATTSGKVSYSITACDEETRACVKFNPNGTDRPAAVKLRIRDPQRRRIHAVTVNGTPWNRFDPASETIALRWKAGTVDIAVSYV